MIVNYCVKCGAKINENQNPTDKPSARIVCGNCSGMKAMEPQTLQYQGIKDHIIEPEELVKVYVNQVERDYIDYEYDANVAGPAMRVLERVRINATAANAYVKVTMDLEFGLDELVKVNGVPDYEETARRVIKQLSFGIA